MQPGNPYWPPPQSAWPQPPGAQQAPWMQPGPQPPFQPGPGGAPGAAPVMEVDVPLQYRIPNQCVCCMAAGETRIRSSGTARMNRTTEWRHMDLPYCARCAAHLRAVKLRGQLIGAAAILLGAVAPFVLQAVWAYVPGLLVMASGPVFALLTCALLALAWRGPVVDAARGCVGVGRAAWIQSFPFRGPITRVRFCHPTFAMGMAQAHNAPARAVPPVSPVTARWIFAPLAAEAVAILAFFAMHGNVYFDNPTAMPMSIDVDHGAATLTLAPGAHRSVFLPLGAVDVVARSGGVDVDHFSGEVASFGTHVATPTGTGCYGITRAAYGTASLDGSNVAEPPQLRWHTLSNVDYVLEPFPHSVDVGRGQTGTTKRRFTRYDCATGQAL